jgi:hypothetical protein
VYHDTMEKNIPYPNHKRMPNVVVRVLYEVGYFLADFGPLFVNLFNVVYQNLRRLFAFFVGLLIELSTVIVLVATVIFSISHSIERLREAGATGGLEYVGVAIFEVVFIASTAMITKSLMNRRHPGWFPIAGFAVGIAFVEWSNITGMAQNWDGWIIGAVTPLLLIISEGVLAYQYMSEEEKQKTHAESLIDLLKNPPRPLTEQEIIEIKSYLETYQLTAQGGTKTSSEMVAEMVENDHQNDSENGTGKSEKMVDEMDQTTDQIDTKNGHEIGVENGHEMVENLVGDTPQNGDQKDTNTDHENGADLDKELVENLVDKETNKNDETPDISTNKANQVEPKFEPKSNPKINQNVGEELVDEVVENLVENETKTSPEVGQEFEPKLDQEINQKDNQNGSQCDTKYGNENSTDMDKETVPFENQKTSQLEGENDTRKKTNLDEGKADKQTIKVTEQQPIITANDDPKIISRVRRKVGRWVKKEYIGKKPPGRKRIKDEFRVCDKLARQFAAELKEKYQDKVS